MAKSSNNLLSKGPNVPTAWFTLIFQHLVLLLNGTIVQLSIAIKLSILGTSQGSWGFAGVLVLLVVGFILSQLKSAESNAWLTANPSMRFHTANAFSEKIFTTLKRWSDGTTV